MAFYGLPSDSERPPELGWKKYHGELPLPTVKITGNVDSPRLPASAAALLLDPVDFSR